MFVNLDTVDESFDQLNVIEHLEESNDVIPENKFHNRVNDIRYVFIPKLINFPN